MAQYISLKYHFQNYSSSNNITYDEFRGNLLATEKIYLVNQNNIPPPQNLPLTMSILTEDIIDKLPDDDVSEAYELLQEHGISTKGLADVADARSRLRQHLSKTVSFLRGWLTCKTPPQWNGKFLRGLSTHKIPPQ